MNDRSPLNQHPVMQAFRASVARLIKPALSPLYQVFLDTKRGIEDERAELLEEMEDLRLEGYEAAAQLVLPEDGFDIHTQQGYFKRITHQGGGRHDRR